MISAVEVSPDFSDPLRGPAHSRRYWTTVNAAEALPGVPTPLNWSWYDEGTERAQARCLVALGTERAGAAPSAGRDQRHLGIFSGHAALNVDIWRRMADAIPGASGASLERDLLGSVRDGRPTRPRPGRYPVVALRMPVAMQRARRAIEAGAEPHRRWWRCAVAGTERAGEAEARAAFAAAFTAYERAAFPHLIITMAAQALFDALRRLGEAVGEPGLEARLTTGLGTLEEGAILKRLWRLAREPEGLDAFIGDYGYQGPGAGELANRSWRAAPEQLTTVLEAYRELSGEHDPSLAERRQRCVRDEAQVLLLGRVPRPVRAPVSALLRLAGAYLPLRESGRAGVLRTIDVARAAARVVGSSCAADGRMHHADDVFMLTVGELTGAQRAPNADELSFRRRRWSDYHAVDIPSVWQGVPAATASAPRRAELEVTLAGIGTGGGVVEGRARVVQDPSSCQFEPGEILICHTTDPSWASLFLLAAAVVIDIGGPISHGAIVARELGIPCVINTGAGTRRLRTGDLVRVNGHEGTVERLLASDELAAQRAGLG